jgi:peptidoglycan hydrolase-like protein with peptidoglycan-binding domain
MANYASKVVEIALNEVGYLEKKTNSNLDSKTANAGYNNYTKYARDIDAIVNFYNGKKNGYAWCDVWTDWVFIQAFGVETAKKLLCQPDKSYGAGCYYSAKYYKNNGRFYTSNPKPGDQIFFWNSKKNDVAHTGIVYDVDNIYVYTVEGNTSTASGVVANGGGVCCKKYKLNYARIYGYGRPAYDIEPATTSKTEETIYKPTVKEWQEAAIRDGYKFPKYGADGDWGNECVSVAKKAIVKKRINYTNKNLTKIVQKIVGVAADGLCGKNTDAAIRNWQRAHGLVADGQVGVNTWEKMLRI